MIPNTKMEHNKTRILETIRQGRIGGGESHLLDLVKRLDRSRFEPVVLSFTDGPMIDQLKEMGVKTHVIHTERPFNITIWGKVKALMQEERIDIVHAHGTRANSNTFWAARKLGLPIFYTVHGWSFHMDQKAWIKKIRVLCEKFLTMNNSMVICVSRSTQKEGLKSFKLSHSCVINNGIDRNRFNAGHNFEDVRKAFGIAPETTLVGYIARITRQKDPLTLMRGFKLALEKAPELKLLVVGDGEMKAATVQLARELSIDDSVIFETFRQDVPNILQAIDVYCLPSLWEAALPIGAMEAMAMKKAIVVTSLDCMKEVIVNQQNGLLIPHQDPDKLAEQLLLLHREPSLRHTLGQKAYDTVRTLPRFDIDKMVSEVEDLYTEILRLPTIGREKKKLMALKQSKHGQHTLIKTKRQASA